MLFRMSEIPIEVILLLPYNSVCKIEGADLVNGKGIQLVSATIDVVGNAFKCKENPQGACV